MKIIVYSCFFSSFSKLLIVETVAPIQGSTPSAFAFLLIVSPN